MHIKKFHKKIHVSQKNSTNLTVVHLSCPRGNLPVTCRSWQMMFWTGTAAAAKTDQMRLHGCPHQPTSCVEWPPNCWLMSNYKASSSCTYRITYDPPTVILTPAIVHSALLALVCGTIWCCFTEATVHLQCENITIQIFSIRQRNPVDTLRHPMSLVWHYYLFLHYQTLFMFSNIYDTLSTFIFHNNNNIIIRQITTSSADRYHIHPNT